MMEMNEMYQLATRKLMFMLKTLYFFIFSFNMLIKLDLINNNNTKVKLYGYRFITKKEIMAVSVGPKL